MQYKCSVIIIIATAANGFDQSLSIENPVFCRASNITFINPTFLEKSGVVFVELISELRTINTISYDCLVSN